MYFIQYQLFYFFTGLVVDKCGTFVKARVHEFSKTLEAISSLTGSKFRTEISKNISCHRKKFSRPSDLVLKFYAPCFLLNLN